MGQLPRLGRDRNNSPPANKDAVFAYHCFTQLVTANHKRDKWNVCLPLERANAVCQRQGAATWAAEETQQNMPQTRRLNCRLQNVFLHESSCLFYYYAENIMKKIILLFFQSIFLYLHTHMHIYKLPSAENQNILIAGKQNNNKNKISSQWVVPVQ